MNVHLNLSLAHTAAFAPGQGVTDGLVYELRIDEGQGSLLRERALEQHSTLSYGSWSYVPNPRLSQLGSSALTQTVFCQGGYRFGFNGMHRDDEIAGRGNALDFGARMYDSRLGRFLSLDPLAEKYSSHSPFTAFFNSPNIFVDPDGKENIIYLTDLRLIDPALSPSTKKEILKQLNDIAALANKGFENKNLTPRVVVIDFVPKANQLERSDVLATLGTKRQTEEFDERHGSAENDPAKYDLVGKITTDWEKSTSMGGFEGDVGNRIALISENIQTGWKANKFTSAIEFAAWLIQHGSGHNAAIGHSDEISQVPDKFLNQKVAKEGNDLMTSGNTSVSRSDKGKPYRDNVGPKLRSLFTRKKFTNNAAQDNLKR